MWIYNPVQSNLIYDQNGHGVRPYNIPIGSWDMDAVAVKMVAHGLGILIYQVISMNCVIRKDDGLTWTTVCQYGYQLLPSVHKTDLSLGGYNSTNIFIERVPGTSYDSTDYNDPAINRGTLFLWISI